MPSCCGSNIGLVSTSPVESLSMMRFGGDPAALADDRRRDRHRALPVTVTVGRPISVSDRFSGPAAGLNSCTGPLNVTAVPTGGRALGRNRKMPSDVRTSLSGCGSCTQMPLLLAAVTTPGTPLTTRPS